MIGRLLDFAGILLWSYYALHIWFSDWLPNRFIIGFAFLSLAIGCIRRLTDGWEWEDEHP